MSPFPLSFKQPEQLGVEPTSCLHGQHLKVYLTVSSSIQEVVLVLLAVLRSMLCSR